MAVVHTIPAGLINKSVIFKQPTSSLNDEGGQEVTYSDAITTRAFVTKFNQHRATEGEAVSLIGALDFYVRWATDREAIDKDWLIQYRGFDYVIHLIEPIDQRQRFIRFTAKSIGNAVISVNGESGEASGGSSGSGGGGDIDMSNLQLDFEVTGGNGTVILTIAKNTLTDESKVVWGDGDEDIIAAGGSISISHEYAPGSYQCKIYPISSVVIPTAQAVNIIESINIIKFVEGASQMTMEVGDSLSKCDFLKFFEAQDWGMTTFPTLPNAGMEQVRTVNIPGNNLPGAYCSNIFIQCDDIGWPVGYIDLTDSPGVDDLSTAGENAKQSLETKGWEVYP